MSDPFELLRTVLVPAEPDPVFASRLRARLTRVLDLPKRATVSDLVPDAPSTPGAVITPYLAVAGARAALVWYQEAFGAHLRDDPIVMADGTVGHAELDVAGATFMLSDEHPEIGVTAPVSGAGAAVTIHLEVADVDAAIGGAVSAGAMLERAAADYDYGRNGVIRDPFGHRWLIAGPASASRLRNGDIGYVSLWVPDVERAAEFFSTVLGWRYAPAGGRQSRQVEGLALHHGLWGGIDPPTLFCCFAVDDIAAATARIEAAGGTSDSPQRDASGLVSGCTDDQGVRFAVFQPLGGTAPPGSAPLYGQKQGDLAYVTMEVVDGNRACAFYRRALGWRFSPGSIADGWQVEDVAPMVGISGGHPGACTVPLYRVGDIAAAVTAVRSAGGTATEPAEQPYGITATCADDQGTRFYLGQLRS